jgi:error-prone DNA polymerase
MPDPPDRKDHDHPWHSFRRRRDRCRLDAHPFAPGRAHRYAELAVTSNFSFLRGASHPDELIRRAAELGLHAIAITDHHTLAGIVRAHIAAREHGVRLVVGTRIGIGSDAAPLSLLLYPTDRASYGRLCRLLTIGKRRAPKGECELCLHDVLEHHQGLLAIVGPPGVIAGRFAEQIEPLRRVFGDRLSVAASFDYGHEGAGRLARIACMCEQARVPMAAINDVHYHLPQRRPLQDVLTCIRHGCTLDEAGLRLAANAERYLKDADEMARLFADHPRAIARTIDLADRAAGFNLDQVTYEYPHEVCPPGLTPIEYLTQVAWAGAAQRYAPGASRLSGMRRPGPRNRQHPGVRSCIPERVIRQIDHELRIIDELNYAPYFLTVYDLVVFARSRGILCQGRGAAANSAVCYCIGVTSVDPARIDVLFERFISKARNEPPDIDIDFEHERREEVIQYIYGKYGRDRAALTAEVITYRGRSAIRDVGKALGLSLDCVDRLAGQLDWSHRAGIDPRQLRELGLDPDDPTMRQLLELIEQILGFPRHLSQHVGGFVMTQHPLCELVPIENAAMDNRTVIEWDKDDIDAMGMMKVDCLGLGMLTALNRAWRLVCEATERRSDEATKGQDHRTMKGMWHGEGSHVPRPGCMAEGHDIGQGDLHGDTADADGRAVRSNQPDAAGRGIDSIQHRRGTRSTVAGGLSQTPAHRTRPAGRTDDTVRTGHRHDDDRICDEDRRAVERNGPCSSGPDPILGEQVEGRVTSPSSLRLSVASSLRLSVSSPTDRCAAAPMFRPASTARGFTTTTSWSNDRARACIAIAHPQ